MVLTFCSGAPELPKQPEKKTKQPEKKKPTNSKNASAAPKKSKEQIMHDSKPMPKKSQETTMEKFWRSIYPYYDYHDHKPKPMTEIEQLNHLNHKMRIKTRCQDRECTTNQCEQYSGAMPKDNVVGALLQNRTHQGNPNYDFIDPSNNQTMFGHDNCDKKRNYHSTVPTIKVTVPNQGSSLQ